MIALSLGVATASAAGAGVVACSSSSAPASDANEAVGTLTAAMSTIGPDGATYTLQPNTQFQVVSTNDGGTLNTSFTFNSTTPTDSFSLPVGTYSGKLSQATSLVRTSADAGASTVTAVLLDPQPYAFGVTQGTTTSLTFHFLVEGLGTLTFSTGTLSTNVTVEAGTAPPHSGQIVTNLGVTNQGLNGPSGLNMALMTGAGSLPLTMSLAITGPFTAGVDQACANITATVSVPGASDAGPVNIEAFVEESSGGTGQICFLDPTSARNPNGQIQINWARSGSAQTAPIIAALGGADAGGANQGFSMSIIAMPTSLYYDGTNLKLAPFEQPLTISQGYVMAIYEPTGTFVQNQGTVPLTLQLSP
jgi:hypothetical protein